MKIAFFTDVYRPTINGVVASIDSFASQLQAMGHEVTIICPAYDDARDDEPGVLRVKAVTFPSYKEYRLASPVSAKVERHMKQSIYDIIHIHSPFSIGLTGIFYAKRFRLPVVYTAHTNYADFRQYVHGAGLIPEVVINKLAAKFSNGVDLTIAPSRKIADSLERWGANKPVTILQTGILPPQQGSRRAFRKKYGLKDAIVMLDVVRLSKEKRLDFLIGAFAQACNRLDPTTRLVIVGDGPYKTELEALTEELGVADRVIFAGFLVGQELADAYAGADFFCHGSFSETQGITLLEASSYGLPLITNDDADIVAAGKNALVSPATIPDFANAMVQLATDRTQRRRLAAQSRKIANGYTAEHQTELLVQAYIETIAHKRLSVVYTDE